MKKTNIYLGIITGILLVLYHLLAFLIPFERNAIFWVSYGFTLDAFVIAVAAILIAFRSKNDIKSKFYGYPIAKIGVLYLLAQVVLCFIVMALAEWVPVEATIILYAIMLAVAVVGLIATDTVRDHIQYLDNKNTHEVSVIRSLQLRVNQIASQCEDAEASKAVKALAEELRYSDPVGSPATFVIESDLSAAIEQLQFAVNSGDAAEIRQKCNNVTNILNERNRLCKLSK